MPNNRIYYPTEADTDHTRLIGEAIKEAREVLEQPPPDTFLGRKTQDPFPKQDEQEN